MTDNNNGFFEDINSSKDPKKEGYYNYNQEPEKEKKFPVLLLVLAGILGLLVAILISRMLSSSKDDQGSSTVEVVAPITDITEQVDGQEPVSEANVYSEVKAGTNGHLNTNPIAPLQINEVRQPIAEKEVKVIAPVKTIKLNQNVAVAPKVQQTVSKPTTAQVVSASWQVQLSASATEASANTQWTKLKSANSDLLGNKTHSIIKKTVSGKTVYRLRVINLSSVDADSLCKSLKSRNIACFATR